MDVRKVVFSGLIGLIAVGLFLDYRSTEKEERETELGGAMLSYLSEPRFSGRQFLKQLTGVDGDFKMYDLDENKVYISVPAKNYHGMETLKRLTRKPEAVQFAEEHLDFQVLGSYREWEPTGKLFCFRADEFRANADAKISVSYEGAPSYGVTAQELADYLDNKTIYSGPREMREPNRHIFANHGHWISTKESSLQRFIKALLGKAKTQEEKAQILLTFVTNKIEYDILDTFRHAQTMKRAPEVLLTKKATCSGKTILYASLLEQIGVDYLLAYMPGDNLNAGHINVLVAGNFSNENGYRVMVFGKPYQVAETTTENFLIGKSVLAGKKGAALEGKELARTIRFVQSPGSGVMELATGRPLEPVKE